MLHSIIENARWIFSGVGSEVVKLTAKLICWVLARKQSASNPDSGFKQHSIHSETPEIPLPKLSETTSSLVLERSSIAIASAKVASYRMSEPTPTQIKDVISGLPPLQQDDMAKGYNGIPVEWELDFVSARNNGSTSQEANEEVIDIAFGLPNQQFIALTVWCWGVKLSSCREFKIMTPGRSVKLTGLICNICSGGRRIDLENVKFTL